MSAPRHEIDHLAVAAATLDGGVAWAFEKLGVTVPRGGEHPKMGTHNAVAHSGDDTYLEVIAVNPDAPAPQRPRWFGLDAPDVRAELAVAPRIATWVVRTTDMNASLAAARAAGLDLGTPIAMTRGDLQWIIACRDDGSLPEGGVLPVLIEWPEGPHPSRRMSDPGLRLAGITLQHPKPDQLDAWCRALNVRHLADIDPLPRARERVLAAFETPLGRAAI